MYPISLQKLIDSFKYLPGIGEKTAERLAFSVLNLEDEQIEMFYNSLKNIKNVLHHCPICNTITDLDKCSVCSDLNRNKKILCVVDDSKTVFLFEKMGMFNGYYHVLNGLISPLDGIFPEDIGISSLIERLKKEKFEEIVFAFKPSIEGETTALYIKKILSDMHIVFTKLASGIPMGTDIEYLDELTLERALKDRKKIE